MKENNKKINIRILLLLGQRGVGYTNSDIVNTSCSKSMYFLWFEMFRGVIGHMPS